MEINQRITADSLIDDFLGCQLPPGMRATLYRAPSYYFGGWDYPHHSGTVQDLLGWCEMDSTIEIVWQASGECYLVERRNDSGALYYCAIVPARESPKMRWQDFCEKMRACGKI